MPDRPPAAAATPPEGPAGHRHRLRQRFLRGGAEAMPDYELLELLLFAALPRGDTKPLAKTLLARFGSFARAITAPEAELRAIPGVGDAVLASLRLARAAALRLLAQEARQGPVLDNWPRLTAYLSAALSREDVEQFRILFLDSRNRLLADEAQARGTLDHAPAYPREVVRRALELGAAAVILVHNHPSGDPTPSRADLATTEAIRAATTALGILVHDHLIVGRDRTLSFRQEGLI
ncbi:RadC family protein [Roseomonas sp. TAS13]|uniref:RadC family protein n=1 Tax=Roseomonas sp. TAS13 TaxID=1926319 RepID=UPI00208E6426|nr:DNA repair protein RadC [Roseomonas sp. TAS13]USQ73510.1 DNA repair protein RadC [Roseomonas mucosa]